MRDVLVMQPPRPKAMAQLEATYRLHRFDLAEDKAAFLSEVGARCAAVVEHRQAGMIVALRVAPPEGTLGPADGRMSLALREQAMARGVLLRPLHDTIYWMPPLSITDAEIEQLRARTIATIDDVLGGR